MFKHSVNLVSSTKNMLFTRAHPSVIRQYTAGELAGGQMHGPFPTDEIPGLDTNKRAQILTVCNELGVSLATDNLQWLSNCLIFLGIQVDTKAGLLHLKLSCFRDLLAYWYLRRSSRHRQQGSLVDILHHTCCVMKTRRTFLHQTIYLLRIPDATKGHSTRLNRELQANLW